MKKIINIALSCMCMVVLAACGCRENSEKDQMEITCEIEYEKSETQYDMQEVTTKEVEPADDEYVLVTKYIPDIYIDLRYATDNNFTGVKIYDFTDAYLRYGTVKKLADAQKELKERGYSLKIWDAYRPFETQEKLWEVYPDPNYVANPANGMRKHNIGGTVDVTLVKSDGTDISMPTEFDDFSLKADRDYSDIEDEEAVKNVMNLQSTMENNGFEGYQGEWWDYSDTEQYEPVNFIP